MSYDGLPDNVKEKLDPWVLKAKERGLMSADDIYGLWDQKWDSADLEDAVAALGGRTATTAQNLVTDALVIDLGDILRNTPYECLIEVWEAQSTVLGRGEKSNPAAFLFGTAKVHDVKNGEWLEPALFSIAAFGDDSYIAEDVERDQTYKVRVTCQDLDQDVLVLNLLGGISKFEEIDGETFPSRIELMRNTFERTLITDLSEETSKNNWDYRLVEGTVVYAGVQPTRSGGQFGRIVLRDESCTPDALEEGDTVSLSAMADVAQATRFGKYSRVLALVITRWSEEYGISGNIKACEAEVLVAPRVAAAAAASSSDDDDSASTYFKKKLDDEPEDEEDDDDDWDDDDDEEVVEETPTEEEDDDDEWDDDEEEEDEEDEWIDDEDDEEGLDAEAIQALLAEVRDTNTPIARLREIADDHGVVPAEKSKSALREALNAHFRDMLQDL